MLWPTLCHTPNLLLCWDVPFHQRFALHASHFDMRRDISELQPQILPADGHFGSSFARTRHWIDLEERAEKKENNQTTDVKTLVSSQGKEEAVSGLFVTTRDNRNYECQTVEGPNLLQIHHLVQLPWKYVSHMPQPQCIQNSAPDLTYSL